MMPFCRQVNIRTDWTNTNQALLNQRLIGCPFCRIHRLSRPLIGRWQCVITLMGVLGAPTLLPREQEAAVTSLRL